MATSKNNTSKKVFRAEVNGGNNYYAVLAKDEEDAMRKLLHFLLTTNDSALTYDSFAVELEDMEVPAPSEENPVVSY